MSGKIVRLYHFDKRYFNHFPKRYVKKRTNSLYRYRERLSASIVFVIAGTISGDLLTEEQIEIYRVKLAENHITAHFRENKVTTKER